MKSFLLHGGLLICLGGLFLYVLDPPIQLSIPTFSEGEITLTPSVEDVAVSPMLSTTTILFTGDVMLSRGVEWAMNDNGFDYPFFGVRDLFLEHDFVVVNLEGTMPEKHVPTPGMTFQFSIRPELAATLERVGVTHTSQANNHAYDYGRSGYGNSRQLLSMHNVQSFGQPYSLTTSSVHVVEHDDVRLALVALDLTLSSPSETELVSVLKTAKTNSDLVIVLVHWGNEYELTHSSFQARWAERFSEQGVDLVIGHHPHVVQDIALVNDTLVFYSLGNFIFDQYFSDDVQVGLALSLALSGESRLLTLIPVTSKNSRNQPQRMASTSKNVFLQNLASRSDDRLNTHILQGKIDF